ncbi:TraR/DksA family transcriptional regulator [Micromonospora sp. NPDC004336]
MYVVSRQDELGVLRMVLEEQYERHSTQLALLDRQARRTCADGADVEAASALTAATRRALGDIARALHYLEQGGYGACERCTGDIAIEELAHRPSARFCATCQPEQHLQLAHGTPTAPAAIHTAPAAIHTAPVAAPTAATAARAGGAPSEGSWPKAGPPSWRRIHDR